jgi:DNA repair protein RecN (Recombination protein N)
MLLELSIHNFALIEKLNIQFEHGLNILTGETGAGKSIIIDAVNMAIGERSDKAYVRTGADKAVIQAVFCVENQNLKEIFDENGIDFSDGQTIILTREIYANGRSVSRVNDRTVTLSLVKEISKHLLDIHGQHAHQSLLYPENHIDILDAFEEESLIDLKKQVADKFFYLQTLKNKLASLGGDQFETERKKELLRFQLNEIDGAKLCKDEEEELNYQHQFLSNSEKIYNAMENAYIRIYEGTPTYSPITDILGNIINELDEIKQFDEKIATIHDTLRDSLYTIEDVAREIRNFRDRIEFNPQLLEQIEKRLDIIASLKRKYGKTIQEILSYREKIYNELNELENREQIIEHLENEIDQIQSELFVLSKQLSDKRKKIAQKLENHISEELSSLNMKQATFKIHFYKNQDEKQMPVFTSKGIDKVEFLISTNSGEPPKPLAKIASGGEISRIMLAFKTILAKTDSTPTLIFDEIDSGISGQTANIVGEKLAKISKEHQVLCITHLPQIALMADHHYYIEKISHNLSTITVVKKLKERDRIIELGRLLGSKTLTDLTLQHAKEMIQTGIQFKKTIS